MVDSATALGIPVIVIDLGYVDRAYNGYCLDYYFQVGLEKLCWIPQMRVNKSRLYKRIKYLKPRKKRDTTRNKPILLATQKPGDWAHRMNEDAIKKWATEQVKEIRKYTDRPIILKQHPLHKGKLEIPGTENDRPFNTEYWLHHCHCLVTYNSTVGVHAIATAIPVYCHESAMYWEISMKGDYSKIEIAQTPKVWHRREFMGRVCYSQWNGEEIASGKPFLDLLDIRQGKMPASWNVDSRNKYANIPIEKMDQAMSLRTFNERRRAVKELCTTYLFGKWMMDTQSELERLHRRVYVANMWHKPRGIKDAYSEDGRVDKKEYFRKWNEERNKERRRRARQARPRKRKTKSE
jgi:hypothetical protein